MEDRTPRSSGETEETRTKIKREEEKRSKLDINKNNSYFNVHNLPNVVSL